MTTTPTTVLDKVLALSMLVTADQQRFESAHQMTSARVHLLWQVGAAGPSTQRDLAAALGVSPRNITGLVDGLVGSGHVSRESHPTDRRATQVTLTASGSDFVAGLVSSHADLAARLFGDLDADRITAFVETLDLTLARFATLVEEGS